MEESNEDQVDFIKYTSTLPIKVIGSVGGLATHKNGNLIVFHRASRKWEFELVTLKIITTNFKHINHYLVHLTTAIDLIERDMVQ
jgi:hypothetical protein